MKKKIFILVIFIFYSLFFGGKEGIFNFNNKVFAAGTAAVQATIEITVCGNNLKETGEQCDGLDLNSETCSSRGFSGGTLSCGASCDFNVSACLTSSGGGGGGGQIFSPVVTSVIFKGLAYPKSTVILLKDAQIAAITTTDAEANFQISISGLSGGNYIFSIYSEDKQNLRSAPLTFPVSVTHGTTTNVSGIFVAPTITVDKSEVKKGDNIAIFGQSAPQAEILLVDSSEKFLTKIIADKDGIYLYNLDTSIIDYGIYNIKAKAFVTNQLVSNWSHVLEFRVAVKNIFSQLLTKAPKKSDLNNDGRINLVDFFIAVYWHKKPSPPSFIDLNGDGKIDLTDFSIMAFYWTG